MESDNKQKGRTADGRFAPGNSGRPKGTRLEFSEAFVKALFADFRQHGKSVIETVRKERPQDYLKVAASLMPKDVNLNHDASEAFVNLWRMVSRETYSELGESVADEQEEAAPVRH